VIPCPPTALVFRLERVSSRTPGAHGGREALRRPDLTTSFYGPPGSITTIPFHQLLGTERDGGLISRVRSFVGSVGVDDERHADRQYPTVFSTSEGRDSAAPRLRHGVRESPDEPTLTTSPSPPQDRSPSAIVVSDAAAARRAATATAIGLESAS
jgi:hypothetical protein